MSGLNAENADLKGMPTALNMAEDEYMPSRPSAITLREIKVLELVSTIFCKANWYHKVGTPEIVDKWQQEAEAQGIERELFNYTISYILHLASVRNPSAEQFFIPGIYFSDQLFSAQETGRLRQLVSQLEDVPEEKKDWHPHSNRQVLDLVHPSLFPLVYGITRVTDGPPPNELSEWCGKGEVLEYQELKEFKEKWYYRNTSWMRSTKYQWLPTDFEVDDNGNAKAVSYINNLHPVEHASLYREIEFILSRFVPLFEKVTQTLLQWPPKPLFDPPSWCFEQEFEDQLGEDYENWEQLYDTAAIPQPDIPAQYAPQDNLPSVSLKGRVLQVIVKLANIELTPENPTYGGGTWHVEGMENETIVASGIYYYACDNITETKLHFRAAIQPPDYNQNDHRFVSEVFGLGNGDDLVQTRGAIVAKEGRCIAFPNTYQHRVAPFELSDKSKPGSRKILVFFLVDPSRRIISTSNVPPQQKAWYLREVERKGQVGLPTEVLEKVVEQVDWPMSLETAKQHRLELMKERSAFSTSSNQDVFAIEFSLCEH